MERPIDFWRDRQMLCDGCGRRFVVDLHWIERWGQRGEKCPGCGLTCEHEDAPRVTVDPGDQALDDGQIPRLFWYHTSTHPGWPTKGFDPVAVLTPETRMRMGGDEHVAKWVARQRAKALHVGTYEAAIHNMLRRMHDQADHDSQFYLYRVQLKVSVVVRNNWLIDPSNFVGDVLLGEVCPPGVDVARYLNYHEDPGGLSLALGRDAIASVQGIALPPTRAEEDGWVSAAVSDLVTTSTVIPPSTGKGWRFMRPPSPRAVRGRELGAALAAKLPPNLRCQFESAAAFAEGEDPLPWARRVSGLFGLVADPGRVLAALDEI